MVLRSSKSRSGSSRSRSRRKDVKRSQSKDATQSQNKIFVSGLSGEEHIDSLQRKLRELFSAKCTIESIDIKRSFNQQYSFAFLEIKETQRLNEVIRELNGKMMDGKKIRVQKQKRGGQCRRDESVSRNRNCYDCGRPGHIARNCPNRQRTNGNAQNVKQQKREAPKEKRRSRRKSVSRSRDRKTKKRVRSSSSSSQSSSSSSESSRSNSSDYERQARHRKNKKRHHSKKSRHFQKKQGKKSRIRTNRTSSESSSQ